MADLPDLDDIYDPDLRLPIRGVTYRIAAPDITEAERLRIVLIQDLTPDEIRAEAEKILGPALDEMRTNGVPDPMALHAGTTALIHYGAAPKLGRSFWLYAHVAGQVDTAALLDVAQEIIGASTQ